MAADVHAITAALLLLAGACYAAGVRRLWRRAGAGRGIEPVHAACFAAGCVAIAAAVLSPLHHLAELRLWAHMVQHELLMVVAAPLLVLGRPLEAWAWAAPRGWRGAFRASRVLADPVLAWWAHLLAVWGWHVPWLFEAAVDRSVMHAAQHASFLLSAAWFWWTVVAPGRRLLGPLLALFATMAHTGALGALMTLSAGSWYASYALDDQQLAGLVMWVPAGLVYPLAALLLLNRSLERYAG